MVATKFNLFELLGDTLERKAYQARQKKAELFWHVDPEVPPSLRGAPELLSRILLDMLDYFLKDPFRGEVMVKVSLERWQGSLAELRFCVENAEAFPLPKLEPGIRSFPEETGPLSSGSFGEKRFDFSAIREFLEFLGSSLEVRNLPGGERQLQFRLSLEAEEDRSSSSPGKSESLRGFQALIVDDSPGFRRALRSVLSSWGMEVREGAGSLEGLRALYLALERKTPFHVMFIDMGMRDMEGNELAAIVRSDRRFAELPLVLLSSGEDKERRENSPFLSLPKPLRYKSLYDTLRLGLVAEEESLGDAEEAEKGKKLSLSRAFEFRNSFSAEDLRVPEASRNSDVMAIPSLKGKTILVAEDNRINREVVVKMLQKTGARVVLAENGEEAVKAVEREVPDLVLMDLHMPCMDGFEAARIILEAHEDLPVIALSAAVTKEDTERTRHVGMKAHLAKPISRAILFGTLQEWLSPQKSRMVSSLKGLWPEELPKEMPGFDLSRGLDLFDGSGGEYRRALEGFFEEISEKYSALPVFLARGKKREAREMLHTLKGVAGTLGAVRLWKVAQKVEKALQVRDPVSPEMMRELTEALFQARKGAEVLPLGEEKRISLKEGEGETSLALLRRSLERNEFIEEELLRKASAFLVEKIQKDSMEQFLKLVHSFEMEEALELLESLLSRKEETPDE